MVRSLTAKYEILILFLFSAFAFLIYANSLNGPFVFDDERSILHNPNIRLTSLSMEGLSKAVFHGPHAHRPLANLTFGLNYFFHQYDTLGYHLVNIVIHIFTGFLLFYFVRITLILSIVPSSDKASQRKEEIQGHLLQPSFRSFLGSPVTLIPFFAALIWLVHPIQIQSVSYVVQRMNSLAAMFYILSLLFYVKARLTERKPTKGAFFSGCALSGIMALASKEIAATLPFFIFLYEWYFFQDLSRSWMKRHLAVLAGMIALCLLLAFVYLGVHPVEKVLSGYDSWDFTLKQRLLTQFRVVAYYISLIFLPHPSRLNLDHDIPISHSLVDPVTTLLALGAVLMLAGIAIHIRKKDRLFSFCILWFLGNLVIESSIIPLDTIFEHRTYLPSMLFCLMTTTLIFRYIKPKLLSVVLLSAAVVIFSIWTHERNRVWSDSVSLWEDAVSKSPNKARPHHNLGQALAKKGNLSKAIQHYVRALEINPDKAVIYNSLGNAEASRGKIKVAMHHYNEALRLDPNYGTAHNNLGFVLTRLGRYKEAIGHYSKAIVLNPKDDVAHDNMGFALLRQGKTREAVKQYSEVERLKPASSAAHNNLGHALVRDGRLEEAIRQFEKALQINPNDVLAYNNLGLALAKQGQLDKAIDYYKKALKINPAFYWAHNNWGLALEKKAKYKDAAKQYAATLKIKPDFGEARRNLERLKKLKQ